MVKSSGQIKKQLTAGKRFIIVLLSLFFMLAASFSPQAYAAQNQPLTVRMGYYEDGDYMYRTPNGEYTGFNIEFLQEISKLSNLEYEIVDCVSWENALQMLTTGEIDLLPAVYFTAERAEQFYFSEQSMCNIYTTLNVRMNDTRYDYEDFSAFQNMTVGIIRGGEDGENFKRYCQENGVSLSIVPYSETADLLSALEDGTLDGVAITHLGRNSIFRSVAQFAPTPLYIAVAKDRPDVIAELNQAMNQLLLRNPSYEMDLYEKYFAPSNKQKPVFTKAELDYLAQADSIQTLYDPSLTPLCYTNAQDGSFAGITADIFAIIAADTGLRFHYSAASPQQALSLLQSGQADIICTLDSDYLWDKRYHMDTTLYYLRTPVVLISQGTAQPQTLALQSGYRLSADIAADNPDKGLLWFDSANDCLDAVLEGKADAAYVNTYVADYQLALPRYERLTATALGKYTQPLCIAVSKDADPRLFSILDKCVQYLAQEDLDNLLLKNTATPYQVTVRDFVASHIVLVITLIVLFLGSIILLLYRNLRNTARSNRMIQDLLYQDPLTGLDNLNRFYLTSRLLLSGAPAQSYALIYCDINYFKLINDVLGFAAGDRLLQAFGQILSRALRPNECCARASADHFVLLLHYDSWEGLVARLEEMRAALTAWQLAQEDIPYAATTVYGVYLVNPTQDEDIQQMLDLANYARRSAKNNIEQAIVLYDEHMRQEVLFSNSLTDYLDTALAGGELKPYFQPKVDMHTGRLIGSEALVRWHHPEYGLIMPGHFIPLFERNGLVKKVDWAIFEAVCQQLQTWLEQGLNPLPVSCNFSRLHFDLPDFPDKLAIVAERYHIPHGLLEIEITESAIASAPDSLTAMVLHLQEKGFLIAIDDFGSGYSSLGQLHQLMANVLKLDRSFVRHGLLEQREQIVIRNLVHLAGELGMTVICEGVETPEQAAVLTKLGCSLAQGFLYYQPLTPADFEQLLLQT